MHPFIEKLFGDPNKRVIKVLRQEVEAINALEADIQKLSDADLQAKTPAFKSRLAGGETLEDIKFEAFAVVREAARRTLGQRHYDVQLMGGLALHNGTIAEMKTGEGKTLSATSAVYLNALSGSAVHLITVNDYLARRDADWMGQVYSFLGLSVACLQHDTAYQYDADISETRRPEEGASGDTDTSSTEGAGYEALISADMDHLRPVSRQEAYRCDILFGTNNEFGFDYLRDNMVQRPEDRVQRGLQFAMIDEVDSILIDEARTPLIISGPAQEPTQQYYQFAQLVQQLVDKEHFTVDEKMRSVALTDAGIATLEKALGVDNLYVSTGLRTVHHIEQALKARLLFLKDRDYVVQEEEVIIIDEFTCRMMQGRRYSEGLHQAIEAKENLPIKQESQTLATITLQNFFRLYEKLSGMTGTASTEAEELHKIYGLEVVTIPSHRELIRTDVSDRVYKNTQAKYRAVVEEIKNLHELGRPILVGTISIEHNEILSQLLTANGIKHAVLNAKQHESEGEIIAQAGRLGAVTVATNMAGRGVDILLGGNPIDIEEARQVRELGGLAVIGTERHESRRIDNQLRGRAGRQGDPGSSQFFVSLDDDLMRIFGSDRIQRLMGTLGVPDEMPIENSMVSRSIESAQKKVEGRNFDLRKHVVEYDDVMNKHRDTIYRKRNELLEMDAAGLQAYALELIEQEISQVVSFHTNHREEDEEAEDWDMGKLCDTMNTIFPFPMAECLTTIQDTQQSVGKFEQAQARTKLIEVFSERARQEFDKVIEHLGEPETVEAVLHSFILRAIDLLWIEHLDQMAYLRDAIGLRGYGQRDPLVEYKRESYQLFQELLSHIQRQVVYNIFKLQTAKIVSEPTTSLASDVAPALTPSPPAGLVTAADAPDLSPNDPCWCGSGKKFKKCHGGGKR